MHTAGYQIVSRTLRGALDQGRRFNLKKASSARNALVRVATRLRVIRLRWMSGRLKSRKRYSRRSSSFVLLFSSIGNGGVSDSARMRKDFARTSMLLSPDFH